MKRYESETIKRIGMRIKSTRALTGNSQGEFCEKYSLSLGAFKTWESGKFAPRMANLIELCRCFENEGIFNATTEWFLNGQGPAPTYVKSDSKRNVQLGDRETFADLSEEIELFKKNQIQQQKEVIIITVSDDLMLPYFSYGDIVGGIILAKMPSLLEVSNKPLLIETKPNEYIIRWCFSDGDSLFIRSQKDALVYRINGQRIGRILWHRSF